MAINNLRINKKRFATTIGIGAAFILIASNAHSIADFTFDQINKEFDYNKSKTEQFLGNNDINSGIDPKSYNQMLENEYQKQEEQRTKTIITNDGQLIEVKPGDVYPEGYNGIFEDQPHPDQEVENDKKVL